MNEKKEEQVDILEMDTEKQKEGNKERLDEMIELPLTEEETTKEEGKTESTLDETNALDALTLTEGEEQKEVDTLVEAEEKSDTQEAEEETSSEEKSEESNDIDAEIANLSKDAAAVLLIKKAKHLVEDAKVQMEECKQHLSGDLKAFEAAKEALKQGGLSESEELLRALGYGKAIIQEDGATEEKSETLEKETLEDNVAPVYIGEVSNGKFGAFILSLLFGGATFSGLVYLATQKLGITLDLKKMPTEETCNTILNWFSSLVDMQDPRVGGAMIGGSVLVVMWIVYKLRVNAQASSNLAFAKEQLQKAEEYASLKGSCKYNLTEVDEHLKDAIDTMKTYEVLLHEQQAKLKRIQHIEQSGEETPEYHEKSLKEMDDTHDLLQTIKTFLNTPLSEAGRVSEKSRMLLSTAKSRLEEMIGKLY